MRIEVKANKSSKKDAARGPLLEALVARMGVDIELKFQLPN